MPLKKINSHNKSEYVYSQIIDAIDSGEFCIGDKLPAEMELAELTGVSRASVREAFSALRLAGILETKKGDGTYVKNTPSSLQQEATVKFDKNLNPFEILEARIIIEPAVAHHALELISRSHLEELDKIVDEMEKCVLQKDFERYHQANKRFHFAIVDVTENRSIVRYLNSLQSVFIVSDLGAELRHRYLTEEGYVKKSVDAHRKIYEALKAKDHNLLEVAWKIHNEDLEAQLLGRG